MTAVSPQNARWKSRYDNVKTPLFRRGAGSGTAILRFESDNGLVDLLVQMTRRRDDTSVARNTWRRWSPKVAALAHGDDRHVQVC